MNAKKMTTLSSMADWREIHGERTEVGTMIRVADPIESGRNRPTKWQALRQWIVRV